MRLVESFVSVEGEGKRVGLPALFLRFFGCNCSCTYCDTPYGWDQKYKDESKLMTVDEVISLAREAGVPAITLTGGEPLLQPDIDILIQSLADLGFEVNIETNGTIVPRVRHENVFYTMDFKTNASGMSDRMNHEALYKLGSKDVLKFVVGDVRDCLQASQFLTELKAYKPKDMPTVYFSPVFGKIEPREIVEYLLRHKMYDYHVQVQLHKVIYPPEMRGV